jgi:hypothetical protein
MPVSVTFHSLLIFLYKKVSPPCTLRGEHRLEGVHEHGDYFFYNRGGSVF